MEAATGTALTHRAGVYLLDAGHFALDEAAGEIAARTGDFMQSLRA